MFMWTKATVLMVSACVAAIVAAGAVAYRVATTVPPLVAPKPVSGSTEPSSTRSAPAPTPGAPPVASLTPAPATSPLVALQSLPGTPAPSVDPAPTPRPGTPAFDVVRVEPTGETVVAGRAAPGARIKLLDGGKVVGEVTADASGQFVVLPSNLGLGTHELALQAVGPDAATLLSEQTVTVAVSGQKAEPVLVALATPGMPTQVLSGGVVPPPVSPGGKIPVFIRAAEAGGDGRFFASGTAAPGGKLRLYLNGVEVATATADATGKWSLTVSKGMPAGSYKVRADQIDAAGAVVARAEVPFDVANGKVGEMALAAIADRSVPVSGADAVVADLKTVKVARGDSLWRISRIVFGKGNRYTQIYEANVKQIRDEKLIYPGQVFVVPRS
jgi:nucleoid-associated protein YgaU